MVPHDLCSRYQHLIFLQIFKSCQRPYHPKPQPRTRYLVLMSPLISTKYVILGVWNSIHYADKYYLNSGSLIFEVPVHFLSFNVLNSVRRCLDILIHDSRLRSSCKAFFGSFEIHSYLSRYLVVVCFAVFLLRTLVVKYQFYLLLIPPLRCYCPYLWLSGYMLVTSSLDFLSFYEVIFL